MKLSEETTNVLKNFAKINPGIVFHQGNKLRTISPQKTVMACATVSDTFDDEAGIFDIGQFLSSLSLFEDPDVSFNQDRFTVTSDRAKLEYLYTSPSMIVAPPDKDIELADPLAVFDMEWDDIEKVVRATGLLQLPEAAFSSDGTDIVFGAENNKVDLANSYRITVSKGANVSKFKMIVKTETLKFIPNDYKVSLSKMGMAHFKSENIEYWVAADAS